MDWTPHITTLADCEALLAERDNLAKALAEQDNLAKTPEDEQKNLMQDPAYAQVNPLQLPEDEQNNRAQTSKSTAGNHSQPLKERNGLAITHLSYDSRNIQTGTLFFCKGAHFKPEYLIKAAQKGAIAYVSETDYTNEFVVRGIEPLPALLVQDIRTAIADIAAYFYRGLLDNLTLIGFTGTKGKSTTTYMLRSILDSWLKAQGKPKSAWLSSIETYDGAVCARATLTTQETLELYEHFVNAVEHDIEYLTMEVSSQALKYSRTRNLFFEVAGFLNIGEDHISPVEHPTHEDYLDSKLKLFKQCHTAVVNLQSEERARILKAAESASATMTFCVDGNQPSTDVPAADLIASHITSTETGLSFKVQGPGWNKPFTLPMAGLFNVENALAALTAATALGVPVQHMQEGLAHCEVSGRMQLVAGPNDKRIIIDYAHNKLSFETLFAAVSEEYPTRPIVCVFGATGSKGTERRLELPAVAAEYANMVYITEDDPGEEPLQHINAQIAEVLEAQGTNHSIIENRDEAIRRAITESPQGSLVLILGKGHETVMKRGRSSVPVPSDRERVERILAADS